MAFLRIVTKIVTKLSNKPLFSVTRSDIRIENEINEKAN